MIMRNNLALIKTKQILDSSSVLQKITIITNLRQFCEDQTLFLINMYFWYATSSKFAA